jgi:putative FmdB family regulatory protein
MPSYEYDCTECGNFTAMRAMHERNEPQFCPACGAPSPRVILTAPAFAGMPPASRTAHATNERAANEPKLSSTLHGMGCTCCSRGKSGSGRSADGAKVFPARRPWMISH